MLGGHDGHADHEPHEDRPTLGQTKTGNFHSFFKRIPPDVFGIKKRMRWGTISRIRESAKTSTGARSTAGRVNCDFGSAE